MRLKRFFVFVALLKREPDEPREPCWVLLTCNRSSLLRDTTPRWINRVAWQSGAVIVIELGVEDQDLWFRPCCGSKRAGGARSL